MEGAEQVDNAAALLRRQRLIELRGPIRQEWKDIERIALPEPNCCLAIACPKRRHDEV